MHAFHFSVKTSLCCNDRCACRHHSTIAHYWRLSWCHCGRFCTIYHIALQSTDVSHFFVRPPTIGGRLDLPKSHRKKNEPSAHLGAYFHHHWRKALRYSWYVFRRTCVFCRLFSFKGGYQKTPGSSERKKKNVKVCILVSGNYFLSFRSLITTITIMPSTNNMPPIDISNVE